MPTFLLPVTRRSLPFASSLLQYTSSLSPPTSPHIQFLISSTSRDLERSFRSQFPKLLSSHEHEAIPDYSDPKDLKEALGQCSGVILAANGCGDDVINLPSNPNDEWLQCEENVASLVSKDHRVVKLSWTDGFVKERSPSAIGRANWELEEELKRKFETEWAHNLTILRAPVGMDAFLRGRLYDLVCGRTLSMSVKRGRIAFVHPLDVAEALSAILVKDVGGEVTLTGPEALTFEEVAQILSNGINDKVNYSNFPLWAVQPARWVRGVPGDAIEEELAVIRALEAGIQQKVDTGDLKALLGRKPRSFREFVAENADAWPRTELV
ncbi:Agroclavine dehydrogenase [Phytophthora citrophthora]|uniref:Agroclavine dehydrogenase n=1 Tax=Phytophthora citrophthora TaxID=4793 RepID=A0AAD9GQN3_9STRA|nr:Agroclavine dehydrogenase [Phytophthora citrophthora]